MSDVTHIVNDQRSINETSKSFDSNESVINRGRPLINTSERQFVSQEPINPAARFRPPDTSNQFQLWRQPPPTGRPPLAYPPNRFPPRNAEPRLAFPPARAPIPPLRTQEFQNRRSFEKPERPYDIELSQGENRLRPNSPWQRIRERLPLPSTDHPNDMESTQMKISAFEDAMNREMNKDRIPPFRRDSIVNADSRLKPQPEKRFSDEDDPSRKNRPAELLLNPQNDIRKQSIIPGEFPRRDGPDPRIFDPNSQHRPSITQLQMNETNYINDRGQQNPLKARPLQAVPEYENRNYVNRNDDERLREDQNRNYRQDSYRDYRKIGDFENAVNKENRKFARPEDFSQRSFENAREIFSNRFDSEMNFETGRGKNENHFNRIDVNGVNDKNALTRDKQLANDSKAILDKKPTANGDIKPPSSLPELKKEKSALKTPTKKISPKSPEIGSANSLGDKKKVPMNKVQVGAAPSPNLKVVRSKIGSLENYTHKPGGGKVKIENRKLEWKVQPKIEAKNDKYAPSGGDKKITQVKLQWSAKSKIGSLDNATHKPGGGDKKIESVKLDFKDKAKSKVGSKDNIKHVPGGGTVKKTTDVDAKSTSSNIEDQKLDIKAQSKVGSLDNVKHRPGGGDKKIFDDKEYLKQTTLTNESSKANSVTTSGSQAPEDSQLCSGDSQQKEKQPVAASTIPVKKSDKPAKDQLKPKTESTNESPKSDKKSQPTSPKKTLRQENASSQKITQKPDTKVDKKPKPESIPQIKPELKKIPSVEKIKTDSIKSKVPTAQTNELVKIPSKEKITVKESKIPTQQTQKPNLEPVSKPQDKSASGNENLSKLSSKEVPKNENNNLESTAKNTKSSEKSIDNKQVSKNESNLTIKPPPEVIVLKKQDSKSKIEPPKLIIDSDKKPPAEVTILKKNSIPKIEPKSNFDTNKITEEKKELNIQNSKPINVDIKPPVEIKNQDSQSKIEPSKSNIVIDKKPRSELKIQDSKSKIEPPKSNIDSDKKPSAEVTIPKKDSIPNTEPLNLDTSKIEEKKESNSKLEPPKLNIDPDKKSPAEITILKKDSIPKIEPKLNSDPKKISEEKKELNIHNSKPIVENIPSVEVIPKKQDLEPKIELKSNLEAGKTEEKKELNQQDLKLANVDKDTKPPIDVIILKKQDSSTKIEPKLSLDRGKTEEKKESNIQDLKSKPTSAENKSNFSNVVSTKEQVQPASSTDLNKSNSDINKSLNKDSNDTNLKTNLETKTNENKNQKSKLDDLNPKLVDEKSKENDVIPTIKPNSEKIPQPEIKQTSETFSPISKSDTEFRTSITTTDKKSISESKPTNVLAQEIKLLPSREGDERKPLNNQILDSSKNLPQNPKAPSSASSTSSSKQ